MTGSKATSDYDRAGSARMCWTEHSFKSQNIFDKRVTVWVRYAAQIACAGEIGR